MRLKILISFCLFGIAAIALTDDKQKNDPWVPMEQRIKIWDEVVSRELGLPLPLKEPKPYSIEPNGIEATFQKEGAGWTIMGANAPVVNPTFYPKDWPVKKDGFEILVVNDPITNDKILPFMEKIDNAVKSDTISITAARDSYEPASFVIRTGNIPQKDIEIEVNDLKAEIKDNQGNIRHQSLPRQLIDIKVVKCWYQAGTAVSDVTHKLLTPELLLHDDDVVRVDYASQVNMLRNHQAVEDAESLRPFSIPARQNKQVWLTVYITKEIPPGEYKGRLRVKSNSRSQDINLNIQVLPMILPPPMLEYAFYYEGHLSDSTQPKIEAGLKTVTQMKAELEDMIAHGQTNATVWHRVNQGKALWKNDWARLRKTLEIRKDVGWNNKPLLYLDWAVSFKDDLDAYKDKVKQIISIAKNEGIKDVYIYGVDEKRGQELAGLKPLYQAVREVGGRNFVAGWIDHFSNYADGLIDYIVVAGPNKDVKIRQMLDEAKQQGNKVLSYNNPQAGVEEPATYRQNYGINLYLSGANGALNYAYQTGSCWSDFADKKWRAHVMAYPTVGKPISTVQWEGWREAVNDIRFLSLVQQKNGFKSDLLAGQSPIRQREVMLKFVNY